MLRLLALLNVISVCARAELRFPQLVSMSRESPATVSPGSDVTFRFAVQPGTTATQSVLLFFAQSGGTAIRTLRATAPASGLVTAQVDATWTNGTYSLDFITVFDEWGRRTGYLSNGSVQATNLTNARENFYTGATTHTVNFAALGFTVSGASALPSRPAVTEVTALTTSPIWPGQSARFRYTGTPGPVPLARIALTFQHVAMSTLTHTAALDTAETNGEIALPVVSGMANGRYRLATVLLTIRDGRQLLYSLSNFRVIESMDGVNYLHGEFPLLEPIEFTIEGASAIAARPQFTSWSRDGTGDAVPGTTLRFNYATTAAAFPVQRVFLRLVGPFGASRDFTLEAGSGTLSIPVTADWVTGPYAFSLITISDAVGPTITYLPIGGTTFGQIVGQLPSPSDTFRFNVRGLDIAPYFTLQPAAETHVRANSGATLTAHGVGVDTVTYQWFRGEPGDTSRPIAADAGAVGDRVTVHVTESVTYWVRITSGGVATNSAAARIVVVPPPVITDQPRSQIMAVGGTATFSVTASGTGPFTYRWTGGRTREGQVRDQRTFQLAVAGREDAGTVFCEVTNVGGTTRSQSATLTVLAANETLRITEEPADKIVVPGTSPVLLRVLFAGNPPLRSRWQKDGVDLNLSDTGITVSTGTNETDLSDVSNLMLTGTSVIAGRYRLVVTNGFETAYSREAQVTITNAPQISTQPVPVFNTFLGSRIELRVVASGQVPLSYQWRQNGVPIPGATQSNYFALNVTSAAAGTYDVVVSNPAGAITSAPSVVTVSPVPVPSGIASGPTDRTARAGETVTFTIVPTGDNRRCTWSKDGRVLQEGLETTFTLRDVGASDSGRYRVLVGLSIARDFTFTVTPAQDAPVVTRQPSNTTANRGDLVRLNAGVDGRLPLTYQWRFNGDAIRRDTGFFGFNEPSLYIQSFDSTKTGAYELVATNSFGTVTTRRATVSLPPPSPAGRLMNLSVRANAGAEHGPLIVGFVLGGGIPEDVPLLIRSAGRALDAFGVPATLANPVATLYSGSSPRFSNDDWSGFSLVTSTAARVGAFPFPVAGSRDAAFAPALPPGGYTVHVTSGDSTGGAALAEIYDATPAAEITTLRPRLLNLSVQTRADGVTPVIVGFALGGTEPRAILIRATGPSLATFGVQGWLADPRLAVFNGSNSIADNNDWGGTTALREAFGRVGAFTLGSPESKDAALVTTLNPGTYTAQVDAAVNGTGLVLVEVYELP